MFITGGDSNLEFIKADGIDKEDGVLENVAAEAESDEWFPCIGV